MPFKGHCKTNEQKVGRQFFVNGQIDMPKTRLLTDLTGQINRGKSGVVVKTCQ